MESSFYTELNHMVAEAEAVLNAFETGRPGASFAPILSVGVACKDGDKLNSSIRNDLGPRRTLEFQQAVFTLATLSSVSAGSGGNVAAHNALHTISRVASDLAAEKSEKEQKHSDGNHQAAPGARPPTYVHPSRIASLKALPAGGLDLRKLNRLLEELNEVHACGCYMATAMLLRTITDHIPPIFGCRTFTEVVSNYSGGKSFKGMITPLQVTLRHIADSHLHLPMRQVEDLPTEHQVDFKANLDALLGEIIRIRSTLA